MTSAVASVSAVEQMQERAEKQQHERQDAQQVRPVFGPEKKRGDGKEAKTDQPASRQNPATQARNLFRSHDLPSYSTINLPLNMPI
jgi:hypothetical protein